MGVGFGVGFGVAFGVGLAVGLGVGLGLGLAVGVGSAAGLEVGVEVGVALHRGQRTDEVPLDACVLGLRGSGIRIRSLVNDTALHLEMWG